MAFHPITLTEMSNFATSHGFQTISLIGTHEVVFARLYKLSQFNLSLRIYTAIDPTGFSREKGSDAIRLKLFWKFQGEIVPVSKTIKCLRVPTWEKNILKGIEELTDINQFKICSKCNSPLLLKKNRNTNEDFWSCSTFNKTKCTGK